MTWLYDVCNNIIFFDKRLEPVFYHVFARIYYIIFGEFYTLYFVSKARESEFSESNNQRPFSKSLVLKKYDTKYDI